jgi:TRAP-type C4-dicarboxylate transport system substrate-binding protein
MIRGKRKISKQREREEKMEIQKKLSFLMILMLGVMLFSTTVASAKPIELSLGLIVPPKHLRYLQVLEPWSKMIEERTKGAVKINPYFNMTLAPAAEMFDATAAGVADLSESYTFGVPGKFAMTESLMLPETGFKTSISCSRAVWHLYKTFPEVKGEYKGVKLLWLHTTPAAKLMMKKKAVRSLDDLKGLKIASSGAVGVKVGKALGFSPVSMPTGDIYEAQDKGVIDGHIRPSELLVSRRLFEVTKYIVDVDLGHDIFFVAMNLNTWNKLPPEVQKVFDELSGDWAVEFTGKAWDKFDKEAEDEVRGKGLELITLSSQEQAKWRKLLTPIENQYAAELESKKLPGKKIFEELKKLGEKSK